MSGCIKGRKETFRCCVVQKTQVKINAVLIFLINLIPICNYYVVGLFCIETRRKLFLNINKKIEMEGVWRVWRWL
ncbi:TPA: hypothetical protein DEG75_04505 [Candidatus Dependentiae bacterium]|nr:hypothetical protein [Candidatus Dependentiae bacterium]